MIYSVIKGIFGQVVLSLVVFLLHKLMISLKYATLTNDEHDKVMSLGHSAVELKKCLEYQTQLQLITGWLQANEQVLQSEIDRVCNETGSIVSGVEFTVSQEDHVEEWKEFFERSGINSEENLKVQPKAPFSRKSNLNSLIAQERQVLATVNIRSVCIAMFKGPYKIYKPDHLVVISSCLCK